MQIKVFDITGEYAVCHGDGHILYEKVLALWVGFPGEVIELSFEGVKVFHFSFFRTFFNQLIKEFPPKKIKDDMEFSDITQDNWEVLRGVFQGYV